MIGWGGEVQRVSVGGARRLLVGVVVVVSLLVAACGSAAVETPSGVSGVSSGTPVTATGTSSTTTPPSSSATEPRPVLATVPVPPPELPLRWAGARSDAVTVTVRRVDGGQAVAEETVPAASGEGGTAVSSVLMQDDAVVVNTCCEPAPGQWFRWILDTGEVVKGPWFGNVDDVDAAGRQIGRAHV